MPMGDEVVWRLTLIACFTQARVATELPFIHQSPSIYDWNRTMLVGAKLAHVPSILAWLPVGSLLLYHVHIYSNWSTRVN